MTEILVTDEQLVERINDWKSELVGEVIAHYRRGDQARGDLAFSRWKERFLIFLKQNIPGEASGFEASITHIAWVVRRGEDPLERFMREDGDTCIAFLDDLIDAIKKGRLKARLTEVSPNMVSVSSQSPEQAHANDGGIYISKKVIQIVKVLARLLLAAIVVVSCYLAYLSPQVQEWKWLQDHPNRGGLYLAFALISLSIIVSIVYPKGWKYWLGTVGLGVVVVVVQIWGR